MDRAADLQAFEAELELRGNGVSGARHLHLVADDVEHAAALQAGRERLVDELDRHIDADAATGADALEVDVHGHVIDRIDLHLARDDAALLAVDIEFKYGGQELAARDQFGQLGELEGDVLRLAAVAIDDAWHMPLAADGAGAAGAGTRTRGSFDLADLLGHGRRSPNGKRARPEGRRVARSGRV